MVSNYDFTDKLEVLSFSKNSLLLDITYERYYKYVFHPIFSALQEDTGLEIIEKIQETL